MECALSSFHHDMWQIEPEGDKYVRTARMLGMQQSLKITSKQVQQCPFVAFNAVPKLLWTSANNAGSNNKRHVTLHGNRSWAVPSDLPCLKRVNSLELLKHKSQKQTKNTMWLQIRSWAHMVSAWKGARWNKHRKYSISHVITKQLKYKLYNRSLMPNRAWVEVWLYCKWNWIDESPKSYCFSYMACPLKRLNNKSKQGKCNFTSMN